jgi:hypothetical protein
VSIYILTIPHQRRPSLTEFDDLESAYSAYGVSNIDDLYAAAKDDMSSATIIRNSDELKEAYALLHPRSHQFSAVSTLLERAIAGSCD